MLKIDPIYNKP